MDVKRVIVYNRFDCDVWRCVSYPLSYSVVSIINKDGFTLKTYTINDASNIAELDINFDY